MTDLIHVDSIKPWCCRLERWPSQLPSQGSSWTSNNMMKEPVDIIDTMQTVEHRFLEKELQSEGLSRSVRKYNSTRAGNSRGGKPRANMPTKLTCISNQ